MRVIEMSICMGKILCVLLVFADANDPTCEIHQCDESIDDTALLQVAHRPRQQVAHRPRKMEQPRPDNKNANRPLEDEREIAYPSLSRFAWRPLFGDKLYMQEEYLMKRAQSYNQFRSAGDIVSTLLTGVSLVGGFTFLGGQLASMCMDGFGMLLGNVVESSKKEKARVAKGIQDYKNKV
eukprot:gnl/TRDRNA2_/TRDRNA2_187388_c0_seq1.p1 gnl/TRDRNA2_/TRDRNA2_187388_c0~~gnl/TRDRNA2_/TRDRNA2_187388_c0_seq1.p1  ORF type:complete len:180 (+),score=16.21 gnl/TRDRNA2_/TRDRNA2_187388_c0_seq1:72-611(+)